VDAHGWGCSKETGKDVRRSRPPEKYRYGIFKDVQRRPLQHWSRRMKTFTQAQVLEITMAVCKAISDQVEMTQDELEATALRVNKGVIKGLEDAGAVLLWRRVLRKN
jgi:predicted GIY-YIG superfamily endonuclease